MEFDIHSCTAAVLVTKLRCRRCGALLDEDGPNGQGHRGRCRQAALEQADLAQPRDYVVTRVLDEAR